MKVKAPESVMAQDDVEALLSLMGINSVDDILGAAESDFGGAFNTSPSENFEELEEYYWESDEIEVQR